MLLSFFKSFISLADLINCDSFEKYSDRIVNLEVGVLSEPLDVSTFIPFDLLIVTVGLIDTEL